MSLAMWVVVAILVAANALYVAAEYGAVGVKRARVQRLAEDGHRLARRLLPHIQTPAGLSRYVAGSQLGITIASLVLGAYAQATIARHVVPLLDVDWVRWARGLAGPISPHGATEAADLVVLVGLAALQALFGEFVPKTMALQFPTEAALGTVLPMEGTLRLFAPLIAVVNGLTRGLLRTVGVTATPQRHLHSPDEIDLLIAQSRDGGLLEPDEQQRLHRALRLGGRTTRDLMVPLARLTSVSIDLPWDDLVRTVVASPFSRLPVYRGSPDMIVGTLRVRDLVHRFVLRGPAGVHALVRPVVRVPMDLAADGLVSVLRQRRAHQAIVVDAADRAVGLITIQDVLEALVARG